MRPLTTNYLVWTNIVLFCQLQALIVVEGMFINYESTCVYGYTKLVCTDSFAVDILFNNNIFRVLRKFIDQREKCYWMVSMNGWVDPINLSDSIHLVFELSIDLYLSIPGIGVCNCVTLKERIGQQWEVFWTFLVFMNSLSLFLFGFWNFKRKSKWRTFDIRQFRISCTLDAEWSVTRGFEKWKRF